MVSQLSWLDHDRAAAERSMRMLSFFKEREARDELGIGGVRDAIADQLFPGTSTIQTRLRYVFFIPWLYAQLEQKNTSSSNYAGAARQAEGRLLQALIDNEPPTETGVIGREAGSTLKRLPSSVYWAALGSWGIRKGDETQQQYFAQADRRRTSRGGRRRRDDGDAHDSDAAGHAWDLQALKLRPEVFPDETRLKLTRAESEFLLDRWSRTHKNSLLTWLALDLRHRDAPPETDRIWDHPRFADFPAWIKDLIVDGRRLDALTRGAALLYNLQLAELDKREELVAGYTERLGLWTEQELPDCAAWQLDVFWPRVLGKGHTITSDTQRFIEQWRDIAVRDAGVASGSAAARQLIEGRESNLKRGRSRFTNRAALRQWGGAAGTTPLTYRWPIASSLLKEWHMGWKQP
ncbi:DUF6361 family protein [Massilia sp.]|uniref:DUF6361 family protein n=1 Tax=Massilia sp. TaxID=1882437 RepID=UPI00289DC408|nr:DUF6361 family protein [Massilia sp.]